MLTRFNINISFDLENVRLSDAWNFKLCLDRFIKSHPHLSSFYYSDVSFPVRGSYPGDPRRDPALDENITAPKNGVFGAGDERQ